MKSFKFITLLSLILTATGAFAQVRKTSDCPGAIPVCQNVYQQTVAADGAGDVADLTPGTNTDCLGGENRTTWYVINVVKDGILVFTLTPTGQTTDYDFAMWDATGSTCEPRGCAYVANNLPVRCNYAGLGTTPANGATGLSTTATGPSQGAGGPSFSSAINAKAGETYILVIDNFSNNTTGYTLDFSASTASIFDQQPPKFLEVGTHCGFGSSDIRVKMSELILCDSLAPDGSDFVISGPNGTNIPVISATSAACQSGSKFTAEFSLKVGVVLTPGNYTLRAKQGRDGNRQYDLCGNQQASADSYPFVVSENSNPLAVSGTVGKSCVQRKLLFNKGVKVNTIALDGSDFTITGPDTTVKIVQAVPGNTYKVRVECDTILLTNTIELYLNKSPFIAGNYMVGNKVGTDGDPIYDTCDAAMGKDYVWDIVDTGRVWATATSQLLCEPGYVYLNAEPRRPPSPTGYGFLWTPSTFVGDTTSANTPAYVTKTTIYKVQILDSFMCYGRDTVKIIVSERHPKISPFTDTTICIGQPFNIKLSGAEEYLWTPKEGISCPYCDSVTVNPSVSTVYTIRFTDQYRCFDDLKLSVTVNPLPVVKVSNDTAIYYGDRAELHMLVPGGVQFLWLPVEGLSATNVPDVYASPERQTRYVLTVADKNSCVNTDTVLVSLIDRYVQLPTAFTPNGDGKNDMFRVIGRSANKVQEFRVFNRWGQEVFNSPGSIDGWDGTVNGKPAEPGVYGYIIRIAMPDGRYEVLKGDITLVR